MNRIVRCLATALAILVTAGCKTYPDYSMDYRFPIGEADIQRGQQAFLDLGCNQCHLVDGIELPEYDGTRLYSINLGGDLIFAKTYGALTTAIINPDHTLADQYLQQLPADVRRRVSSSPMYRKDEMTVAQLIDLVGFLNSRYRLLPGYTEAFY